MFCHDELIRTPATVFRHTIAEVGEFQIRPLCSSDFQLLHQWVTAPRATFWGMQDATLVEVADCYQQQIDSHFSWPYLAFHNGKPAFLLETYDPAWDELGQHYTMLPGDIGMHFLVAPADGAPVHGFTRAVMATILAFLFADAKVQRVVVEPDVNNQKIHPLNRDAGFQYQHTVALSYKTAWFATCDRSTFLNPIALETAV
nr:GNAT family N-acetyltransferase [uncultured Deefgea sp.]